MGKFKEQIDLMAAAWLDAWTARAARDSFTGVQQY